MEKTTNDVLADLIFDTDLFEEKPSMPLEGDAQIIAEIVPQETENTIDFEKQAIETLASIEKQVQEEIGERLIWLKKSLSFVKLTLHFFLTSGIIFAFLLVTSNYTSYYTIAYNYFYPGELEQNKATILNSVLANSIVLKKDEKLPDLNAATQTDESIIGSQHSIKQLIAKSNKSDVPLDIEITPFENRIVIPKIGKNVPMMEVAKKRVSDQGELQDVFMQELQKGVVRYPGSARPGKDGTTFIFGHSSNFPWVPGDYNNVFALLDKVVYDDVIIVYFDQKKYVYKIREKQVIRPGDVSVLKRNNKKNELTLMTCWPVGTTLKRLVVTGELIESADPAPTVKKEAVAMK